MEQADIISSGASGYCIADERAFLDYLARFFHRVEVEVGHLEMLAQWARGRLIT